MPYNASEITVLLGEVPLIATRYHKPPDAFAEAPGFATVITTQRKYVTQQDQHNYLFYQFVNYFAENSGCFRSL